MQVSDQGQLPGDSSSEKTHPSGAQISRLATALEVDRSRRAGEMWQLLRTPVNRRCWLKVQSRGGWRLTKISTARVYVGNHRIRPTGPSPGLPEATGTWQVWAARQQPLCLSAFGKSSSRLNGGKEWLPLVNHKVGLQNGRYKGRANASNSPDLLLTLKGRSAQPPKGSMPLGY